MSDLLNSIHDHPVRFPANFLFATEPPLEPTSMYHPATRFVAELAVLPHKILPGCGVVAKGASISETKINTLEMKCRQ